MLKNVFLYADNVFSTVYLFNVNSFRTPVIWTVTSFRDDNAVPLLVPLPSPRTASFGFCLFSGYTVLSLRLRTYQLHCKSHLPLTSGDMKRTSCPRGTSFLQTQS